MDNKLFTGIDHPAVAADHTIELAQWYISVLDYTLCCRTERDVFILAAPDGSLLEVMPKDDTARPTRTTWTPGWSHLALRVKNLDQAAAALRARGVAFPAPPAPAIGGGRLLNFTDPEGNMLQIVQRP